MRRKPLQKQIDELKEEIGFLRTLVLNLSSQKPQVTQPNFPSQPWYPNIPNGPWCGLNEQHNITLCLPGDQKAYFL